MTATKNKSLYEVPILFLIYKNPEVTHTTFEAIRKIQPKKLFIAADGPKKNAKNEAHECNLTRDIIKNIDWKCDVKTRFLKKNLGLKMAVSSAITWFFSHVDEGIILEYDCLPNDHFFKFCQAMLIRYRHDRDIFSISGSNFQNGLQRGDGDYYYSNFFGCWGWATWKRSWDLWQPNLPDYDIFVRENQINNFLLSNKTRRKYINELNNIVTGRNKTTWAFCFEYAQLRNSSLSIVPNKNLISNIGFNSYATHSKDSTHPLANLPSQNLTTFKKPTFKIANHLADEIQISLSFYKNFRRKFIDNFKKIGVFFIPLKILIYLKNKF